jgi:hypothetical protein
MTMESRECRVKIERLSEALSCGPHPADSRNPVFEIELAKAWNAPTGSTIAAGSWGAVEPRSARSASVRASPVSLWRLSVA